MVALRLDSIGRAILLAIIEIPRALCKHSNLEPNYPLMPGRLFQLIIDNSMREAELPNVEPCKRLH